MAVFLVILEFEKVESYNRARKKIQPLVTCKLSGSAWLVEFDGDALELQQYLQESILQNDSLFISELNHDWASVNMHAARRWLAERHAIGPSDHRQSRSGCEGLKPYFHRKPSIPD
jgi:hypothetical protein